MTLPASDIERLIAIVRAAGERILPYYQKPQAHGTRSKKDRSPVTEADLAAHEYILQALANDFPGITCISEEDAGHAALQAGKMFFLVDPLDGTRSFVRGEDEFTVNIGLVEGVQPVLGIIGAPVEGSAYWGGVGISPTRQDGAGERRPIHARRAPEEGLTVTRSRSAPSATSKAFLDSLRVRKILPMSSAIKFCRVAEGAADVYPRFGRTMEWDTAAGHAIINAAGGRVTTADGAALTYGKPGFENPAFIAWGNV